MCLIVRLTGKVWLCRIESCVLASHRLDSFSRRFLVGAFESMKNQFALFHKWRQDKNHHSTVILIKFLPPLRAIPGTCCEISNYLKSLFMFPFAHSRSTFPLPFLPLSFEVHCCALLGWHRGRFTYTRHKEPWREVNVMDDVVECCH